MRYYSDLALNKLKRERLIASIILIALSLIVAGTCVLLCFFINEYNQIWIQLVNTILTILLLWTMIYLLDMEIIMRSKKIKHYYLIEESSKKEIVGNVIRIGSTITLSIGISGREILMMVDGKQRCLYLMSDFEACFKEDDYLRLIVSKEFITFAEVIKNE